MYFPYRIFHKLLLALDIKVITIYCSEQSFTCQEKKILTPTKKSIRLFLLKNAGEHMAEVGSNTDSGGSPWSQDDILHSPVLGVTKKPAKGEILRREGIFKGRQSLSHAEISRPAFRALLIYDRSRAHFF